MKIEDKIDYLLTEDIVKEYSKIPLRARLLVVPLDKGQTFIGKTWDDIKKQFDKHMSLKVSKQELENSLKEIQKLKIVTVSTGDQGIKVELTKYGVKLFRDHQAHVKKQLAKPPIPVKYTDAEAKQIQAYYASKGPGGYTGD